MNKFLTVIVTLLTLLTTGCFLMGKVARDGTTYTAEIVSSLQRQEFAAIELFRAAKISDKVGSFDSCSRYAGPALLIEAKARPQAYRALWLAGLPYPKPDGSLPEDGEEQQDPGAAPAPKPITSICRSGR